MCVLCIYIYMTMCVCVMYYIYIYDNVCVFMLVYCAEQGK